MIIRFPVVVCLAGAVANFALWVRLGNFRVREKPPASRAGLSVEERQRKDYDRALDHFCVSVGSVRRSLSACVAGKIKLRPSCCYHSADVAAREGYYVRRA